MNWINKLKFQHIMALNPLIRILSNNLGQSQYISITKRDVPIIVSLTASPEEFDNLELTIYSIMKQSLIPDKIVLWISDKYANLSSLPYSVTKYIKNGLEIKAVRYLGEYSQILYAIKEHPESIIVTAENNIIYPSNWLEKLYHSYIVNPEDIHSHSAHKILLNKDQITTVKYWKKYVSQNTAGYNIFPLTEGGILYPPNCFTEEVFREDVFNKYAPNSDEVWLWIMSLIAQRKTRVVKNNITLFSCTNIFEKTNYKYKKNKQFIYNNQIASLSKFYRQNIIKMLRN